MKIFCSGIGGIGLSAYASLQHIAGNSVSGSDRADSALLDDLRSQGINILLDQSGAGVSSEVDLFVYSEAIPPDAPERKRAAELGIPQQSYPEALAAMTANNHPLIAVCGTHGKSSTTAMSARLLMHAGRDPTVVVGTKLRELQGRNWRRGREGGLSVIEACEYRNSFVHYRPSIILLTNCDGDHFDYFASLEEYRKAFVGFISSLPPDGVLITHLSDPDCAAVAKAAGVRTIDADAMPLLSLKTPGLHMQKNAQLALALAEILEIPTKQAEAAISGYAGSWRRLEFKGVFRSSPDDREGIPVIDDYGHHPVEIRATLDAILGEFPGRRVVCAFQPHTHDRTIKLYREFTHCFRGVDTVIITDIYDARSDTETDSVDVAAFVRDIAEDSGVTCIDGRTLMQSEQLLKKTILKPKDVLLCMGAGTITDLATAMTTRA